MYRCRVKTSKASKYMHVNMAYFIKQSEACSQYIVYRRLFNLNRSVEWIKSLYTVWLILFYLLFRKNRPLIPQYDIAVQYS